MMPNICKNWSTFWRNIPGNPLRHCGLVLIVWGEMVFKLKGETHAQALIIPGASLFDPSGRGRPMKEWVKVPAAASDLWTDFADAALAYVSSLPKK